MSVPGVYGGMTDKFPIGALMEKGLTLRTGQTHVQKYSRMLLDMIMAGKIDTTFLSSHRLPLEQAAEGQLGVGQSVLFHCILQYHLSIVTIDYYKQTLILISN